MQGSSTRPPSLVVLREYPCSSDLTPRRVSATCVSHVMLATDEAQVLSDASLLRLRGESLAEIEPRHFGAFSAALSPNSPINQPECAILKSQNMHFRQLSRHTKPQHLWPGLPDILTPFRQLINAGAAKKVVWRKTLLGRHVRFRSRDVIHLLRSYCGINAVSTHRTQLPPPETP